MSSDSIRSSAHGLARAPALPDRASVEPKAEPSLADRPSRARSLEEPSNEARAEPSREEIERAATTLREALRTTPTHLDISIDEATGRTVVKLVDSASGDVLRQIPSEEMLEMAAAAKAGSSGVLVRQRA